MEAVGDLAHSLAVDCRAVFELGENALQPLQLHTEAHCVQRAGWVERWERRDGCEVLRSPSLSRIRVVTTVPTVDHAYLGLGQVVH